MSALGVGQFRMPQRAGITKEPPRKSTKFTARAGINSGGARRHSWHHVQHL